MVRDIYVKAFPKLLGTGLEDQMVYFNGRNFTWYRYSDDYLSFTDAATQLPLSSFAYTEKASFLFRKNIDEFRKIISIPPHYNDGA